MLVPRVDSFNPRADSFNPRVDSFILIPLWIVLEGRGNQ